MFQLADPLFHRFLSGSWRTPVVVFAAVDEVSFPLCFFVELVGKTVDPAGSQYFGIDTVFSQGLSYGNAFTLFFVSQLFEFFRERQGVSRNAPDMRVVAQQFNFMPRQRVGMGLLLMCILAFLRPVHEYILPYKTFP